MTAAIRRQRIPPPAREWRFYKAGCGSIRAMMKAERCRAGWDCVKGQTWKARFEALSLSLLNHRITNEPEAAAFRLFSEKGPA